MALGIPWYILLNAEYTEGPIALKFSHTCLADHHSYCINGICVFHHELKKATCRYMKLKPPYKVCSGERRPL
uniref:Epithelial mitogen n=1 Tax=Monodelphis domestica TaxID=13616 RepID=A0A5F8H7W8_MONDO